MKRTFDIVTSGVALVVLSPVLALVAIFLRVRHGRPILFTQHRVGRGGAIFEIHKFRTMEQRPGPTVTSDNDSRVHSTGALLRATKVDELPQLWDVFRGCMTIVGPRPEVPEFVSHWPVGTRDVILSMRPGITDPASIEFRRESELLSHYADPRRAYIEVILPKKCDTYVDYVRNASFRGDLVLIARTIRAVVLSRGKSSSAPIGDPHENENSGQET